MTSEEYDLIQAATEKKRLVRLNRPVPENRYGGCMPCGPFLPTAERPADVPVGRPFLLANESGDAEYVVKDRFGNIMPIEDYWDNYSNYD